MAGAPAADGTSAPAPRFPRDGGGRRDAEPAAEVDWLRVVDAARSARARPSQAATSSPLAAVVSAPELDAEPAPAAAAAAAAAAEAVTAEGAAAGLPTAACALEVTASAAAAAAEYMAVLGVWSGKPPLSAPCASAGAGRYGPP